MLDLIREILQTLRNNKLRTALTGIAVAWGIFLLIILLGVSRGVYNSFSDHAMSNGSRIDIYNGYTSLPYKGLKENRFINIRKSDIDAIVRENPEYINGTSARVYISGTISTPKNYITGGFNGVYPEYARDNNFTITNGRFINDKDMQERRKVMVISRSNAELLFDSAEDAVGKNVKCCDLAFTIVGVYDRQGWISSHVPFNTALQLNGGNDKVYSISLSTTNFESVEQAQELESGIRQTMSRRHNFAPKDRSAIWIWNQFVQQMTMLDGLGILDISIWIIGILTMLSGIVGVSNIMFVSVRERTHEIGIRRAIGAKPRNILTQIICESISITALFGYVGIFFGICVTELLSVVFSDAEFIKDPTVSISIALSVTVVLVVAGCLAGIFPALKALKIKPVEALRTE